MTLSVVEYPHAVLRSKSRPVDFFDSSLTTLVKDMFDTMTASGGVGLSAPQIGESLKIVVMDPSSGLDNAARSTLVNPKITWKSRESDVLLEGCLSLPGKACKVQRSKSIEVEFQDVTGKTHTKTFNNFEARIIQHEIDHLEGVIMTDVAVKPNKISLSKQREASA
jgi:peptide deformylase